MLSPALIRNAEAQQMTEIWERLPKQPFWETELNEVVKRAAGVRESSLSAGVQVLVLSVRNAGVLTRLPDGPLARVAECPQWADNGPGTKAFNEHLHHLGDEERARIDAELATETTRSRPSRVRRSAKNCSG